MRQLRQFLTSQVRNKPLRRHEARKPEPTNRNVSKRFRFFGTAMTIRE